MSDETTITTPSSETSTAVLEPPAAPPAGLTDEERELCAQVAHGAVTAYCRTLSHGNLSDWDNSPDWQHEQARAWVRAALDDEATIVTTSKLDAMKAKIAAGVVHAMANALRGE